MLRISNSFDLFLLNKMVSLTIMSNRILFPLFVLHLYNNINIIIIDENANPLTLAVRERERDFYI